MPQNREVLFQVSFALGLDETGASRLLGAAAETGIHYRNPEELAYAFALRTGASYEKALELKDMANAVCGGLMGGGREGKGAGRDAFHLYPPAAGRLQSGADGGGAGGIFPGTRG